MHEFWSIISWCLDLVWNKKSLTHCTNNFCGSQCYDATILCSYLIALWYKEPWFVNSFRARGFDCPNNQTPNTFGSISLYLSLWLNMQRTGKNAFFWCCILAALQEKNKIFTKRGCDSKQMCRNTQEMHHLYVIATCLEPSHSLFFCCLIHWNIRYKEIFHWGKIKK